STDQVPVEAVAAAAPAPTGRPAGAHRRTGPSETRTASGPLAGSVLSADTWRQAVSVARGRAR
ncbi:MAG: hypothetical protein JWR42_1780, partial [Marmoricola sp.]|nr:hypothetical protein [Marmoricola sp.]